MKKYKQAAYPPIYRNKRVEKQPDKPGVEQSKMYSKTNGRKSLPLPKQIKSRCLSIFFSIRKAVLFPSRRGETFP